MKRYINLSKKFQNKIFFSRVNLKILNKVISFINSHSKADLDKNFYKSRYLFNRRFYSFICKINDNIIGHVGFYKYPIKNNKKNIYSRHSSVVHKNFRNQKIYSKLVEYSIKYLNNLDSLILWPNKNNLKVKIKSLKTIFTYKINNELIFFKYKNKIKLKKLDKLSILNKYYKSNTFKNIFSKDKNFFSRQCLDLKYNDYFYNEYKNKSIAIFTNNKLSKNKVLIEFIGNKKYKIEHLKYLSGNLFFNYCINKNNYKNYKKNFNFLKTGIKFSMILMTNKKFNLNYYDIPLSDTDSFLNTKN